MNAVLKREFLAYFYTPLGYVFIAAYYLFTGFFFFNYNLYGNSSDMRSLFSVLFTITIFLALLMSPQSGTGIIGGKYIAALCVDITRFRKFYTLLVSASNDGQLLENSVTKNPPALPPELTVTFFYRDLHKAPDTMTFSSGSLRRLRVTVNGVTEFACLERYARVVETALAALAARKDFTGNW